MSDAWWFVVDALVRVTLTAVVLGSALLSFIGGYRMFKAIVLAARCRKPNVSLMSALSFRNVKLRPELYSDEAQVYWTLFIKSWVLAAISIIVASVASALLQTF